MRTERAVLVVTAVGGHGVCSAINGVLVALDAGSHYLLSVANRVGDDRRRVFVGCWVTQHINLVVGIAAVLGRDASVHDHNRATDPAQVHIDTGHDTPLFDVIVVVADPQRDLPRPDSAVARHQ